MSGALTSKVPGLAEVAASLVEPDIVGPLNELSEALLVVSTMVSKLRRAGATPVEDDLAALDEAATRSITLTRAVREHFQSRRLRGDYSSLSHVVREVAAHVQPVMPPGVRLDVHCPLRPAIVAAERAELRRLVLALLELAVEEARRPGTVRIEVTEKRDEQAVVLDVRAGGSLRHGDPRLEDQVKPLVFALGGTLQVRPLRDGPALVVRLRGEG
jgi:signal transduction histidine kinase